MSKGHKLTVCVFLVCLLLTYASTFSHSPQETITEQPTETKLPKQQIQDDYSTTAVIITEVSPTTSLEPTPIESTYVITSATVATLDLRTSDMLCAKQLEKGLRRNLADKADLIIQYAEEYQICSSFIAAVAALESGWGTSNWAVERNNYFGFAGGKRYESFEDSLRAFCSWVAKAYLSDDGQYFEGYTVAAMNVHYCESDEWTSKIEVLMKQIYNDAMSDEEADSDAGN